MPTYWKTGKQSKRKEVNFQQIFFEHNLATASLFWNTSMAAVMSWQNTQTVQEAVWESLSHRVVSYPGPEKLLKGVHVVDFELYVLLCIYKQCWKRFLVKMFMYSQAAACSIPAIAARWRKQNNILIHKNVKIHSVRVQRKSVLQPFYIVIRACCS